MRTCLGAGVAESSSVAGEALEIIAESCSAASSSSVTPRTWLGLPVNEALLNFLAIFTCSSVRVGKSEKINLFAAELEG
jgi:hypothetical protein